jgi:hypothetical protein
MKPIKFRICWFVLVLFISIGQVCLIAQEAKFKQLETDGLVCMEAENYSGMRESGINTYWELVEEPENYSGTGGMQALPADPDLTEHKDLDNAQSVAPVLEYAIEFISTDPVYVWARSSHLDGYDDSVWFGMDELIEGDQPL